MKHLSIKHRRAINERFQERLRIMRALLNVRESESYRAFIGRT